MLRQRPQFSRVSRALLSNIGPNTIETKYLNHKSVKNNLPARSIFLDGYYCHHITQSRLYTTVRPSNILNHGTNAIKYRQPLYKNTIRSFNDGPRGIPRRPDPSQQARKHAEKTDSKYYRRKYAEAERQQEDPQAVAAVENSRFINRYREERNMFGSRAEHGEEIDPRNQARVIGREMGDSLQRYITSWRERKRREAFDKFEQYKKDKREWRREHVKDKAAEHTWVRLVFAAGLVQMFTGNDIGFQLMAFASFIFLFIFIGIPLTLLMSLFTYIGLKWMDYSSPQQKKRDLEMKHYLFGSDKENKIEDEIFAWPSFELNELLEQDRIIVAKITKDIKDAGPQAVTEMIQQHVEESMAELEKDRIVVKAYIDGLDVSMRAMVKQYNLELKLNRGVDRLDWITNYLDGIKADLAALYEQLDVIDQRGEELRAQSDYLNTQLHHSIFDNFQNIPTKYTDYIVDNEIINLLLGRVSAVTVLNPDMVRLYIPLLCKQQKLVLNREISLQDAITNIRQYAPSLYDVSELLTRAFPRYDKVTHSTVIEIRNRSLLQALGVDETYYEQIYGSPEISAEYIKNNPDDDEEDLVSDDDDDDAEYEYVDPKIEELSQSLPKARDVFDPEIVAQRKEKYFKNKGKHVISSPVEPKYHPRHPANETEPATLSAIQEVDDPLFTDQDQATALRKNAVDKFQQDFISSMGLENLSNIFISTEDHVAKQKEEIAAQKRAKEMEKLQWARTIFSTISSGLDNTPHIFADSVNPDKSYSIHDTVQSTYEKIIGDNTTLNTTTPISINNDDKRQQKAKQLPFKYPLLNSLNDQFCRAFPRISQISPWYVEPVSREEMQEEILRGDPLLLSPLNQADETISEIMSREPESRITEATRRRLGHLQPIKPEDELLQQKALKEVVLAASQPSGFTGYAESQFAIDGSFVGLFDKDAQLSQKNIRDDYQKLYTRFKRNNDTTLIKKDDINTLDYKVLADIEQRRMAFGERIFLPSDDLDKHTLYKGPLGAIAYPIVEWVTDLAAGKDMTKDEKQAYLYDILPQFYAGTMFQREMVQKKQLEVEESQFVSLPGLVLKGLESTDSIKDLLQTHELQRRRLEDSLYKGTEVPPEIKSPTFGDRMVSYLNSYIKKSQTQHNDPFSVPQTLYNDNNTTPQNNSALSSSSKSIDPLPVRPWHDIAEIDSLVFPTKGVDPTTKPESSWIESHTPAPVQKKSLLSFLPDFAREKKHGVSYFDSTEQKPPEPSWRRVPAFNSIHPQSLSGDNDAPSLQPSRPLSRDIPLDGEENPSAHLASLIGAPLYTYNNELLDASHQPLSANVPNSSSKTKKTDVQPAPPPTKRTASTQPKPSFQSTQITAPPWSKSLPTTLPSQIIPDESDDHDTRYSSNRRSLMSLSLHSYQLDEKPSPRLDPPQPTPVSPQSVPENPISNRPISYYPTLPDKPQSKSRQGQYIFQPHHETKPSEPIRQPLPPSPYNPDSPRPYSSNRPREPISSSNRPRDSSKNTQRRSSSSPSSPLLDIPGLAPPPIVPASIAHLIPPRQSPSSDIASSSRNPPRNW